MDILDAKNRQSYNASDTKLWRQQPTKSGVIKRYDSWDVSPSKNCFRLMYFERHTKVFDLISIFFTSPTFEVQINIRIILGSQGHHVVARSSRNGPVNEEHQVGQLANLNCKCFTTRPIWFLQMGQHFSIGLWIPNPIKMTCRSLQICGAGHEKLASTLDCYWEANLVAIDVIGADFVGFQCWIIFDCLELWMAPQQVWQIVVHKTKDHFWLVMRRSVVMRQLWMIWCWFIWSAWSDCSEIVLIWSYMATCSKKVFTTILRAVDRQFHERCLQALLIQFHFVFGKSSVQRVNDTSQQSLELHRNEVGAHAVSRCLKSGFHVTSEWLCTRQ